MFGEIECVSQGCGISVVMCEAAVVGGVVLWVGLSDVYKVYVVGRGIGA